MPYVVRALYEQSINLTNVTSIFAPNFTAVGGDLLICAVAHYGPLRTITMSDNVGSNDTWTRCETGFTDGARQLDVFYLPNCAAGSCTVVAAFDGIGCEYPCIAVIPVAGMSALSPFLDAVFNYQSNPGTNIDAVTSTNLATLATQPAMLFGITADLDGAVESTPILGTGFTNIGSGWNFAGVRDIVMRAEHKRVTVTTADAAVFTCPTAGHGYLTAAVAFKEEVLVTPPSGRLIYILP